MLHFGYSLPKKNSGQFGLSDYTKIEQSGGMACWPESGQELHLISKDHLGLSKENVQSTTCTHKHKQLAITRALASSD